LGNFACTRAEAAGAGWGPEFGVVLAIVCFAEDEIEDCGCGEEEADADGSDEEGDDFVPEGDDSAGGLDAGGGFGDFGFGAEDEVIDAV